MKKYLLLTMAVLLGMVIPIQAEEEEVFPKSDAIWVIHMYPSAQQLIYGLSGDTIINNLTYQKLYLLNDTTLNISEEDIYVAGIRQVDKKVWVQPADKKDGSKFEEFLMYDFSKILGEYINFGKRPLIGDRYRCSTFECVAIEELRDMEGRIYSENIENGKRILGVDFREHDLGSEWVEGIGCKDAGLYYFPIRVLSGGGNAVGCELICMKENNEVKYMKEDCTSCFGTKTLSIADKEMNEVYVNYIPTQITIGCEGNKLPFRFDLVSIDARNVLSYRIIKPLSNFSTSNIPKGIYIYKIGNDDFVKSGKLIIE